VFSFERKINIQL